MVVVVGMDLDSELLLIVITGTEVRDCESLRCGSTPGTCSSVVDTNAGPEQVGSWSVLSYCGRCFQGEEL